jgi:hypothetical protein
VLINDPGRATALGIAARAEVRQRYSFDRMVRAFEDLYTSRLDERASARTQRVEAAGI